MTSSEANHPDRIRVLVVDDYPLMRIGLAATIAAQADMVVAGEAGNGREAIERFHALRPDVTVMDIAMPELDGVEALCAIRAEFKAARILMLATFKEDVQILRAIQGGAAGFLLKSALRKELLETIRGVHAGQRRMPPEVVMKLAQYIGEKPLTAREIEVLEGAACGHSNKEIAQCLLIAEDTVKAHMKNVLAKLDAKDRTHAMAIAIRRGMITV